MKRIIRVYGSGSGSVRHPGEKWGWIEFDSAHELLMNLNSTFAKSMNLNLNLVFSKSMNLNSKIKKK